ncbi:unnamed protein product [Ectocarpus sp. 12 AP-2014]
MLYGQRACPRLDHHFDFLSRVLFVGMYMIGIVTWLLVSSVRSRRAGRRTPRSLLLRAHPHRHDGESSSWRLRHDLRRRRHETTTSSWSSPGRFAASTSPSTPSSYTAVVRGTVSFGERAKSLRSDWSVTEAISRRVSTPWGKDKKFGFTKPSGLSKRSSSSSLGCFSNGAVQNTTASAFHGVIEVRDAYVRYPLHCSLWG